MAEARERTGIGVGIGNEVGIGVGSEVGGGRKKGTEVEAVDWTVPVRESVCECEFECECECEEV